MVKIFSASFEIFLVVEILKSKQSSLAYFENLK